METVLLWIAAISGVIAVVATVLFGWGPWRDRPETRILRSIQRLQHIFALLGELEGELRPHGRGPSSPRSRYDAIRRQLQAALVGMEIALPHSHRIAHATQDADRSPQRFAEAFEELRRALQQEQGLSKG